MIPNTVNRPAYTIEGSINDLNRMILGAMVIFIAWGDIAFGLYFSSFDIIYRELYLVPVLLGAFWFGLKGAIVLSTTAALILFSCATLKSSNMTGMLIISDYIEILVFITTGVLFGILRDRERMIQKRKLEAVMAMAGTVRHELNNPLANTLLAAEYLREKTGEASDKKPDIDLIINNLKRMKRVIQKITSIDRIELKHYASNTKIIDINKSAAEFNSVGSKEN